MTDKVPPKAPPPLPKSVNHHIIELNWKEYLDRLKEVFKAKSDGRIQSEMQCKQVTKDNWKTIYSGYDCVCVARNLSAETNYGFRLRFKNNYGWGKFSDELVVETAKQPMTGEHIHRAIRAEDKEQLLRILEKGEANIEAQDNLDFTPLMASAQKGIVDIVQILIDWKADLDAKNESGKTALMLASFKGQTDCVNILVNSGAHLGTRDKSGLGPLHYAVDGENPGMIRTLLKLGANVDDVDGMGWSALIRCAGLKNNGNVKVAQELLNGDASIDLQDNSGMTALHNAIINNHCDLCSFLLERGASLDIRTKQGNTAMELAKSLDMRAITSTINAFIQKKA